MNLPSALRPRGSSETACADGWGRRRCAILERAGLELRHGPSQRCDDQIVAVFCHSARAFARVSGHTSGQRSWPALHISVGQLDARATGLTASSSAQRSAAVPSPDDAQVAERGADAAVERERDGELAIGVGERARAAEAVSGRSRSAPRGPAWRRGGSRAASASGTGSTRPMPAVLHLGGARRACSRTSSRTPSSAPPPASAAYSLRERARGEHPVGGRDRSGEELLGVEVELLDPHRQQRIAELREVDRLTHEAQHAIDSAHPAPRRRQSRCSPHP